MLFDLPLPWDALHLATIRNLPGYTPGFVEFEPPIVDPVVQSVFILNQSELGKIGKLTLRKLGQTLTEVRVEDAPSPEDKEAWRQYVKNDQSDVEQILEDLETLRQKKDNLAERRRDHLQDVMQAYFNRLLHDLTVWTANRTIPPSYLIAWGGLAEWPDKRNLSQEAKEYFEKYKLQIGKEMAKLEEPPMSNTLQAKWNAMGDETKGNFRKAWKIWKRMRKEYRREFNDGQTKNAQPKIKDWQTKVMEDLAWDVSESRLRDVKEMGEARVIQ